MRATGDEPSEEMKGEEQMPACTCKLFEQARSHQVRQKQTVYVSPHEHWAVPVGPGCQHPWVYRGWLPPVGYNRGNKAEEYRESS